MKILADLLMKSQMPKIRQSSDMQPEELTLTARKKRPLSGNSVIGADDSLPKGGQSGI